MTVVRKAEGLDAYPVEDETVVLHLASRQVHKLNATASLVWDLLDESQVAADVATKLSTTAEIELTQAQQDVDALITQMLEQGLLVAIPLEA